MADQVATSDEVMVGVVSSRVAISTENASSTSSKIFSFTQICEPIKVSLISDGLRVPSRREVGSDLSMMLIMA